MSSRMYHVDARKILFSTDLTTTSAATTPTSSTSTSTSRNGE